MKGDKEEKTTVRIDLPLPDKKVFASKSVSEALEILVKNPYQEFSKSQLQRITDRGWSSMQKSIEILDSLDLIKIREDGKKNMISINSERIDKPDNPLFSIPQDSFRKPVRKLKNRVIDEVDYVAGIIVFGSVARGQADRASDIDIVVIVEDNLTETRRKITEMTSELEKEEIDGQRYEFEVLVESAESIEKRGKRMKNIFSEGIVLHKTKTLDNLKEKIFNDK